MLNIRGNVGANDCFNIKYFQLNYTLSNIYLDCVYSYFASQKYITFDLELLDNGVIRIWLSAENHNRNSVNQIILEKTSMCVSLMNKFFLVSKNFVLEDPIIQWLPFIQIKSHPPLFTKDGGKELIIFITPNLIAFYPLTFEGIRVYTIKHEYYTIIYDFCKSIAVSQ